MLITTRRSKGNADGYVIRNWVHNSVDKCDGKKRLGRPKHMWKNIKHFEERNVFQTDRKLYFNFSEIKILFFTLRGLLAERMNIACEV